MRLVLWGVLAALLFLGYQQWQLDYGKPPVSTVIEGGASAAKPASSLADSEIDSHPASSAASAASAPPTPAAAAPAAADNEAAAPSSAGGALLHVITDVLDVQINLKGGELDHADLLQYPLEKNKPNTPVTLLTREPPSELYLLQTGLKDLSGQAAPSRFALFSSAAASYQLEPGANELRVPLSWSEGGLTVVKTFVFRRGAYGIDVQYDIKNDGEAARKLAAEASIVRHWVHPSRSYFNVETYSFKGPAVYDGSKSKDLNVESTEDSKYEAGITNGWMASLQHQFVSAVVPPAGEVYQYKLTVQGNEYRLSATGPEFSVAPGKSAVYKEQLFVGPKLQSQLTAFNRNLERTVDFGLLTILAQPLFTGLNFVHKLVGNWGWAIIIVTALIKLLFYPLSQASGRSMARMRAVQPRLKQIQETFKDDREKLGRAMMDLYKKEKINPLAGCLPMVVQIPVFLSYYRVLLESVEMRQAPFMLWISDLSSRDPYFVLPLFMGAAMFAQFKLNPTSPDPMQAKVMQFMPLVMTGMMAWFPSGLVLYWLTNTVLSILQQWRINQVVETEAKKRRN
jgi:YidC/Oxa1 family membrane protein insertase